MNEWMRELLLLPPQSSTVAAEIDALHYFVISVTMIGAFAVGLVAFIFAVRFRRREGHERAQQPFHLGVRREVALISVLAVLFIWWWWIGIAQFMRIKVPPPDATEIYVVAKQWMFKFSYPEGHASVSDLYVPAGRPIRLIMTSRDVIHDFYVPEFRVKHDIVPGRYTTLWFEAPEPGEYQILCAEFCGTNHSLMRGKVVVLPANEYAAWLAGQYTAGQREPDSAGLVAPARAADDLAEVGLAVAAEHGCLRCHSLDGTDHIGPSFAGLYETSVSLESGETVVADAAYLTQSMMDPLAQVHHGFQPVMPSYRGVLQPGQVAALLELMQSLREDPRIDNPQPQAEGLPRYRAVDPRAQSQETPP
jgi:cytochrome c oxidase subunit 2